eukprot:1138912-Pelagomonas_calceolata.AAC.3
MCAQDRQHAEEVGRAGTTHGAGAWLARTKTCAAWPLCVQISKSVRPGCQCKKTGGGSWYHAQCWSTACQDWSMSCLATRLHTGKGTNLPLEVQVHGLLGLEHVLHGYGHHSTVSAD